ncbi:hypothetical protein Tco_1419515 [Tanacetum coccineum]
MVEYSQKWNNGTSRGRSTKTSDGLATIQAQLNNLEREIKKVNENVYAAQVGCEQCKGTHYTKDFPQKEEGKTLEEAYYTQFGGPFQGGGYRATAPGKETQRKFQFDQRNSSYDRFCHKEPRSIDQNFRNTNWENEQVLEDLDAYRDKRIDDIIFGKLFLREVGIKTKRFKGIITLYNGDDEVTYQMVRSHPRFKHHINEQCNKILPLLKVSEKDEKNGISHTYQKLKGIYKGVLNLGPDYIRDAKIEE